MQMVGAWGTGKATVAKLAAFIEDCAFFRPYVSRTYSLVEFRDNLKKGCIRAGVKGDNTVLFLTDNLVKVSLDNSLTAILKSVKWGLLEYKLSVKFFVISCLYCCNFWPFLSLNFNDIL